MLRAALMQKPLRKLAGLRCGYASRHLADSAAAPDHFTANLQHKTEEELRQLLADQGYDPDEQELPHILKSFEEDSKAEAVQKNSKAYEYGGPRGPEPTRFGDWEKGGRCSDF